MIGLSGLKGLRELSHMRYQNTFKVTSGSKKATGIEWHQGVIRGNVMTSVDNSTGIMTTMIGIISKDTLGIDY